MPTLHGKFTVKRYNTLKKKILSGAHVLARSAVSSPPSLSTVPTGTAAAVPARSRSTLSKYPFHSYSLD